MSNFVVTFPLNTETWHEHILDKRFEIGRRMYNALVNITQKRYKEMIKTRRYRELLSSLTGDKEKDKKIYAQINEIRVQHRFTQFSFYEDVDKMRKSFDGSGIDSTTARKIASYLWTAYEKLFYGNGKKINYKKYGCFNTFEGVTNKSGIRLKKIIKEDTISYMAVWGRTRINGNKKKKANKKKKTKSFMIPVSVDLENAYEVEALNSKICYCRILRKFVRNKYKFYLQIVFEGYPPRKIDKKTGKFKHSIGQGDVGLDIGTSTIAISSQSDVKLLVLADKVHDIEKQKQKLLRKMDRSRRAMNPNNYNEDGTIKKQGNKKVVWIKSNHYKTYEKQLRELYRKQADARKYQHECLANYIISLGDNVYVETMRFSALQKRAKETKRQTKATEVVQKDGTTKTVYKCKRKKRFGKSLGRRAPSMLLTIIDRKLNYHNKNLVKINTQEAKASQFNHFDGTYTKKALSNRWNTLEVGRIQRDMYSAFLIMNIASDLKSFNLNKCNDRFENFLRLHNIEVQRLKGQKNLTSIGI